MFNLFKKKKGETEIAPQKEGLLQIILCFYAETFIIQDIIEIIKNDVGFKPYYTCFQTDNIPINDKLIEKLLNKSEEESKDMIYRGIKFIDDKEQQSIDFLHVSPKPSTQVIYWVIDDFEIFNSSLFKSLISNKNFVAGFCADEEDLVLQSIPNLFYWNMKKKTPPKIIKDEFGDSIVDISKNPGRREKIPHTLLISCWRMWFGKPFFQYASSEKLLSFPKAHDKKVLENELIFIELYENPFDAENKENRKIQQAFRDWIDMDALAKRK